MTKSFRIRLQPVSSAFITRCAYQHTDSQAGDRRTPRSELGFLPTHSVTRQKRVPLYLLDGPRSGSTQIRWSSSSSGQDRDGEGEQLDATEAPSNSTSGSASPFGFQSLSSLLRRTQAPKRLRYHTANVEPEEAISESAEDARGVAEHKNEEHGSAPNHSNPDSSPSVEPVQKLQDRSVSPIRRVASSASEEDDNAASLGHGQISLPRLRTRQEKLVAARLRVEAARRATQSPVRDAQVLNPFLRQRMEPSRMRHRESRREQRAWGLSEESVASPLESTWDDVQDSSKMSEDGNGVVNPATAASDDSTSVSGMKLTHVKSTGEAHMVDVGAKANSRRVAIATAVVGFSNPNPFQLIFENNNTKGDVLGVARIAGIMAAKRTSHLIPLCHPLALSKVEVDVKLHAPKVATAFAKTNLLGLVTVEAHVETTGPTGVEMEALTAASAASLTVYDMCKAVDRSMRISTVALRYKSGGKSGLFYDDTWAARIGRKFFIDRNLEMPKVRQWVEDQHAADP